MHSFFPALDQYLREVYDKVSTIVYPEPLNYFISQEAGTKGHTDPPTIRPKSV